VTGGGLVRWLDERYRIQDLLSFMGSKKVPVDERTPFLYLGGVSLFLFIIQVATGILLLFYYKAGVDSSYESVRFLLVEVEFGWLVRSIHSWSANLFILAAFLHMFSVFFMRSYRKPRELTWVTGFLLLALAMGFGFSGYLLPWNELAFFATKVGTGIAGAVPLVGKPLMFLLRGGEDVSGATLSRFFGIHVAMLPGLFVLILAIHLIAIQRQGMAEPEIWRRDPSRRRTMPFFPNFALRDLLLWLIVLNVLALLAVFAPDGWGPFHWHLGDKADPFAPPAPGIRPEWYFVFMFQALKLLPPQIAGVEGEVLGILGFGAAGLLWMLLPFWDLGKKGSPRGERAMTLIGVAALAFIVIMTVLGYVLE
jgi:cytochrome b6